jgi:hypothetical protein
MKRIWTIGFGVAARFIREVLGLNSDWTILTDIFRKFPQPV